MGSPRFRLICLSNFQRGKLISYGVEADRLDVVPTPSRPLPGSRAGEWSPASRSVLFAGRVAPGKGLEVYLAAATMCPEMSFQVAGTWAERDNEPGQVAANVHYLGRLGATELAKAMRASLAVVVPSTCYEGLPMVVLEAMALGVPVVASGHGGLQKWCRTVSTAACSGLAIPTTWGGPYGGCGARRSGPAPSPRTRCVMPRASYPCRFFERTMGVYERAIRGR